ncbi:PadR family transcriptional regulator [Natrialbaceae archaeon AArc-T1-2]|uniref:PadR family transcriptional regulator n=1 Tax=Natrialbaceae archaeon AArc-T1-2 TaxID=3053904 RepID=UPI00255ABF09|nr:PadR family transcriptional regulator [Natrialbaceae archaeon AArc-T1-2]WIV67530.1 PadR family transcriptional regulator [Natrialbaceae archaeon AArc-T1-2]
MNSKLLPLALLEVNDEEPIEGITRFMKLVFLAQEERLGRDIYEYVPGQYGPFSKELYDDLDKLERKEFVERVDEPTIKENDRQVYQITDKGRRTLRQAREIPDNDFPEAVESISELKDSYNSMDLWDLLEYVYAEYPHMAENSVLDIPVEA